MSIRGRVKSIVVSSGLFLLPVVEVGCFMLKGMDCRKADKSEIVQECLFDSELLSEPEDGFIE